MNCKLYGEPSNFNASTTQHKNYAESAHCGLMHLKPTVNALYFHQWETGIFLHFQSTNLEDDLELECKNTQFKVPHLTRAT